MNRLILRTVNPILLFFLAALGIALQTSLFSFYPLNYLQPDALLLLTLWCALRRSFVEGGCLTLVFGYLSELHSASPQGLFLLSYMLLFLGVSFLSRFVTLEKTSFLVILTLGASVFWKLATLGTLHLLGISQNQWRHTLVLLFPGAVMAGLLSVWAYPWLEKIDTLTLKTGLEVEEEG